MNGLPGTSGPYAFVYDTTQQVIGVDDPILFGQNGPISPGIVHTPGSASIVIAQAGDYDITWTVTFAQETGAQFALFADIGGGPVLVPGSIFGAIGTGATEIVGNVIATLPANVTLTLRNHTSAGNRILAAVAGGTELSTTASVAIRRFS